MSSCNIERIAECLRRSCSRKKILISAGVPIAVICGLLVCYVTGNVPPDVQDLTITNITEKSATANWVIPKGKFGRIIVEANIADADTNQATVRCAVVSAHETTATCEGLKPCSNMTVTVWTQVRRPFWRSSEGLTTNVTFVPGQAPDAPKKLSFSGKSPSRSLLHWDPPKVVPGAFISFWVNICDSFNTCPPETENANCTPFATSESQLEFNTNVDRDYCVMLKASSRCRDTELHSLPIAEKIRTPVFEPGRFDIEGRALNSTSVEIVVHPPEIKNGPLDKCVGTLRSHSDNYTFTCDNRGSGAAKIEIGSLHPGNNYTCTVQFMNKRKDGQEMAASESTWVVTPVDREESSPDSGASFQADARTIVVGLVLLLVWQPGRP